MSVLSDTTIRKLKILTPFSERGRHYGMTYGLGPASYDVRIDQPVTLKPGERILASTFEFFEMPNNVVGEVMDKSSWARLGLSVQNTHIDPGWRGFLTLELKNENKPEPWWAFWRKPKTLRIHRGMPVAQIKFEFTDMVVEAPYDGKFQDQPKRPVNARYEHADGRVVETDTWL